MPLASHPWISMNSQGRHLDVPDKDPQDFPSSVHSQTLSQSLTPAETFSTYQLSQQEDSRLFHCSSKHLDWTKSGADHITLVESSCNQQPFSQLCDHQFSLICQCSLYDHIWEVEHRPPKALGFPCFSALSIFAKARCNMCVWGQCMQIDCVELTEHFAPSSRKDSLNICSELNTLEFSCEWPIMLKDFIPLQSWQGTKSSITYLFSMPQRYVHTEQIDQKMKCGDLWGKKKHNTTYCFNQMIRSTEKESNTSFPSDSKTLELK